MGTLVNTLVNTLTSTPVSTASNTQENTLVNTLVNTHVNTVVNSLVNPSYKYCSGCYRAYSKEYTNEYWPGTGKRLIRNPRPRNPGNQEKSDFQKNLDFIV